MVAGHLAQGFAAYRHLAVAALLHDQVEAGHFIGLGRAIFAEVSPATLSTFQARTRDGLGNDQQTVQWDDVRETLETIERFGREVLAKGAT